MVPGGGIEPPTRGFSIRCSTPELPGHSLRRRSKRFRTNRRANESGPMARLTRLGKRELVVPVPLCTARLLAQHIFGAGRWTGDRIAIAKPLREIAVFAPLRAEWSEVFSARLLADRAGAIGLGHALRIWALGASSARVGSVSIRTCLPVRRVSSSSQCGFSLALRAG